MNFSKVLTTASLRATAPSSSLAIRPALVQCRNYHEKVIDHYEKPRNVGSFSKTDPNVGTGLVGAPACGDVMKLQIKVDDSGKIVDVAFKTFGCGSAIASSSLATEKIKGLTVWEASKIKNTEIAKELALPPVKLHCSSEFCGILRKLYRFFGGGGGKVLLLDGCIGNGILIGYLFSTVLAEDAIKSAVRDWQTKRQKAGGAPLNEIQLAV
ncbi:iron-binding protein [Rhizophlyctis rosea]|nr:iron-binding protein [Rhizophlyctis rosea]